MALSIPKLPREEPLAPGHRLCSGCAAPLVVKLTFKALRPGERMVAVVPTGCLEVATTIYPETAWKCPFIHVAFENAAAVASGIEAGFKVLIRKGKYKGKMPYVVVFGGDGGTFDIGLQALSGMLERGHKVLYICYDNEAYMNTGIQRSGATPYRAWTTTSPVGRKIPGKPQFKKNIVAIAAAHEIPYAATASIAYWADFITKVRKALDAEGPSFIHVLAPCPRGWRYDPRLTITVARLAVETRFAPLYEVEYGRKVRITVKVPRPKPVTEYLKIQGRYAHLLRPEYAKEVEILQRAVNEFYEYLEKLEKLSTT
ncbi:MAG: pyruvate ferredoxin oxidoreductase [Thermoprotei archaeon]|nr:MAG: pyruvate ferredoxin oxidoreductase [Thermoprotei archaeon]RLF25157.1 MAG: pyruvate ferredoxin oxidoreductase [Thermoprotei archaeon]